MISVDPNILIHPQKGRREKNIPKTGVLLVNPTEARSCLEDTLEKGGMRRFLFNSGLVVSKNCSWFCAGPAIGAPMAVMNLEKLIALGAEKIVLFGWCGALSKELRIGDVLVPHSGISGEGTSRYYSSDEPRLPSLELNDRVDNILKSNKITVQSKRVWSTDAIYREDRRGLKSLADADGVDAVDMEYSALCTVARFRKIQFSSVLVVSDELWTDSWKPGFSDVKFRTNKEKALSCLLANMDKL